MKFTVSKAALLDKLIPAMGSVSVKNTIRSIEGVLIETRDDGKIEISTYDMNKGFKAYIDAESIEEEGKYIINAQRLLQTVRVLSDEFLTIEVKEDLSCTIKSGRSSFSMQSMKGSEFPSLPELSDERGFEISSSLFRKIISKVINSVSDTERTNINGALIEIEGDRIKAVSCNGVSLSTAEAVCDINSIGKGSEEKINLRLPGHSLSELLKILPDEDGKKVSIFIARKHAVIKMDDIIFFTRTVDGDYIEYERLIPSSQTVFVTLDREALLSALERANLIAEEKIQGSGRGYVKITVKDDKMEFESVSANGKVYDEMDCVHEGDDIEIGFNCRLLISAVKSLEDQNIKITMKSPTQAITLEGAEQNEKEKYFYMVLPVRMNG